MSKTGGFTIVELLVAIVVVAILVVISVITYSGVTARTFVTRAQSELSALSKATTMYRSINGNYPPDVSRDIPSDVVQYITTSNSKNNWPTGPWPGSVYDYDYFLDSDNQEVVQISIRFCPQGGHLNDCKFPNESWAKDFGVDSSAYWCIEGACRAHPNRPIDYPGYCLNCKAP
ncbi:prepilin-type N-terminal cleavage/methylation domain-containing protein [Candidatus Saccharibacteria bacterium]|nr:prepilin-type N-terminal cleavage/methylation domain-containing protein [Candidatus Saccharibacteria bacterium]